MFMNLKWKIFKSLGSVRFSKVLCSAKTYYLQCILFTVFTPVFSVTRFFRNHSNMLICCSRNIYHQCFKKLLNIFVKMWFFSELFDENKVQKNSIWNINIFCNILNVFNVTFEQCNASLLNKCINFYWAPNFWIICIYGLFMLITLLKKQLYLSKKIWEVQRS